MAPFWRELRGYVGRFATNWSTSEAPLGTKVRLLLRNRVRSLTHGGCCGHHGEPGC